MKKSIKYFLAVALLIRLCVVLARGLEWNLDEYRNYRIAQSYLAGNGYSLNGFQTSYHSNFTVFLYIFLQKAGVSQDAWALFVTALSFFLFSVSVFYFQKILLFFVNEKFAYVGTLLYIFYPSNVYFVGGLVQYENISVPLFVIAVFVLLRAFRTNKTLVFSEYVYLVIAAIISSWLRPTSLAIYGLTFCVAAILSGSKRNLIGLGLSVLILIAAQAPALIKNKNQFGHFILSNQHGFELLQGHNELARGSWRGAWEHDTSIFAKYVYREIPGYKKMNEYEQSQSRKRLALQWIKDNPMKEIVLCIRKIAIYFLPKNLEVLKYYNLYNPVNAIVHLGFISFCIITILKFIRTRSLNRELLLLMSIPATTILLTLIYFVVYRVRFYAEPIMILFTIKLLYDYFSREKITAPADIKAPVS